MHARARNHLLLLVTWGSLCILAHGLGVGAARVLPAAVSALEGDPAVGVVGGRLERSFDQPSAGFHRTILTQVTRRVEHGREEEQGVARECSVLLRESLPRTFYFDLYELERRSRFQAAAAAAEKTTSAEPVVSIYSAHDVELERSAEVSREHTVWLLATGLSWQPAGRELTASIRVPIHTRYQAARLGEAYANATIGPPQVFVRCEITSASTDELESVAGWKRLHLDSPSPTLHVQVPIGNLAELPLVRFGTFLVTIGAAVALCTLVWWKHARAEPASAHAD